MSKLLSKNYTSDFRLVEVYVNDAYMGVYLLAEQQQVNKHRVDIKEPEENYEGTDIGYFLEYDGYASYEENMFRFDSVDYLMDVNGSATSEFETGYTIKSDITSDKQKSFIKKYMTNIWNICYNAAYWGVYYSMDSEYNLVPSKDTSVYSCVSRVVDLESLADAFILEEIICDPDIYWSSFYMDVDLSSEGDKKLRFEAPWDFDSTLGNKYNLDNAKGQYAGVIGKDVNQTYDCANPWMLIFCRSEWFMDIVKTKWTSFYDSKAMDQVYTYIEDCEAKYGDTLEKNFTTWPKTRSHSGVLDELSEQAKSCKTQKASAEYLEAWLKNRIEYMNTIYHK